MTSPRIPQDEVDDVVARAAELAAAEQRAAAEASAGASVADVKQAAREAGIDPAHVERALAERQERARRLRRGVVLGGLGVGALAVVVGMAFALRAAARWFDDDAVVDAHVTSGPQTPVQAPGSAGTGAWDRSGEAPLAREDRTVGTSETSGAAAAEPEAPTAHAEAPAASPLVPRMLSGQEAAVASAALTGDWQLASWLSLGSEQLEVPARRRAETEPPAEAWQLLSSGRFRHSFSDGVAAGGRWSVAGTVSPPERVAWLGIETWWLVALDDVTLSYDPLAGRGREWALVARDGDEAVFVYLGKSADASEVTLGGRFTKR
jgi:hypothetical protein